MLELQGKQITELSQLHSFWKVQTVKSTLSIYVVCLLALIFDASGLFSELSYIGMIELRAGNLHTQCKRSYHSCKHLIR